MTYNWVCALRIMVVLGCAAPQFVCAQTINPFDFALEHAGQSVILKQQKTSISTKQDFAKKNDQLKYNQNLPSPNAARSLIERLTQTYGTPTSIRGASYVWDIPNPDSHKRQAKIVTIIVDYQPTGVSKLIMNRDRGEDGRASWALPRRVIKEPSQTSKSEPSQMKTPRNKALVNPN